MCLTSAGEELRRKLVPALIALENVLAETSDVSGDIRGLLRIGFVLTTEGPALSRLVAEFQARYPDCEVRLQEVETFAPVPGSAPRRDRRLVQLARRRRTRSERRSGDRILRPTLAVAPSHRLAAKATVSIEDLADEQVALLPSSTPTAVYDLLIPPLTPSGRPIRRTQPVRTINEILSFVARGHIVHPTSSNVPIFDRDDVVLIPFDRAFRSFPSVSCGAPVERTPGSARFST